MSTASKGSDLELKAIRILKADGYEIHRAVRTPVRLGGGRVVSNANDIYGCFDVLARRHDALRHIQVTDAQHVAARQCKVREKIGVAWPTHGFRVDSPLGQALGDMSIWLDEIVTQEVWGWCGGRKRVIKNGSEPRAQCFRVTRFERGEWVELADLSLPGISGPLGEL